MQLRSKRSLMLSGLLVVASATYAHSPDNSAPSAVQGRFSVDVIRLDGTSPQVPLRQAGVVANSETVELDGKILKRGEDYSLETGTGMLILMVPYKAGQTVRATYRHDASLAKSGDSGAMKFQFKGGTSMSLGLGMAERGEDGSVLRTDLVALQNKFSLGFKGGHVSGLFAVGNRRKMQSSSGLGTQSGGQDEGGSGRAIVQTIGMGFAGGTLDLNYQWIDPKFQGTSAFTDAGFSAQQTGALMKERGIRRTGLSLRDAELADGKLGMSFSNVSDKGKSIQRRSMSFNSSGFEMSYLSRKVDAGFQRFRDLQDGDRDLLMREAGLDTSEIKLGFKGKSSAFSANQTGVKDGSGQGFERTDVNIQSGGLTLGFRSQSVDQSFRQFNGIRLADAGQIAREQGYDRQIVSLEWKLPFAGLSQLSALSSKMVSGDVGSSVTDFAISGPGFSVRHTALDAGEGSRAFSQQSGDEQNANTAMIGRMALAGSYTLRNEDKNAFISLSGIRRESTQLSFNSGKSFSLRGDVYSLSSGAQGASLGRIDGTWSLGSFTYSNVRMSQGFTEISRLAPVERSVLGNTPGVDRSTLGFTMKIGTGMMGFSQMEASNGTDGARRTNLNLKLASGEISYFNRKVTPGFESAGDLVDPDRELLAQMRGFGEQQFLINWLMMKNLAVKFDWSQRQSILEDRTTTRSEFFADWTPTSATQLTAYRLTTPTMGADGLLTDASIERLFLSHNLQRFGLVTVERETVENSGSENLDPSSVRQGVSYETRLDANTSVRTEQSQKRYSNGDSERISANTVSTKLSKDSGLSVTDVHVKRIGAGPSERKRNYGFWFALPGGMKFSYGYARELGDNRNGTLNQTMGITGGTVGGLNIGNASYNLQRWDTTRNRSLGNFTIGTKAPLSLGFVKNFEFLIGTDTVRDYAQWQRESLIGNFAGQIGGLKLGYNYTSQMVQNKFRAVDRAYRAEFQTGNFKARGYIKHRTLPNQVTHMARDIELTWKPNAQWQITHSIQTMPEQHRGDAVLGSILKPERRVAWSISQVTPGKSTLWGLGWEEHTNDQQRTMTRLASANFTFFADTASPLKLSYGLEQGDLNGVRRTVHRYSLDFNQRPGPNQFFMASISNTAWMEGLTDPGLGRNNWNVRIEYQLRF